MIIPQFKFAIAASVLHVTHTKHHAGWIGFVCGREFYEDQDGAGHWYYVRWTQPEGKVESERVRLSESELVAAP